MMRRVLASMVFAALVLPLALHAQGRDETLADIRQEMSVLYVEIQKLKRELSTTGSSGDVALEGSLIGRVNSIEGELTRLTAQTEQLELRINRIVSDGTNRLGDLEFRLVELEGGDVSQLGETSTLGGGAALQSGGDGGITPAPAPARSDAETGDQPSMAVSEQADFEAAEAALDAGRPAEAARLFEQFRQDYPGGPLSGEAGLKQGQALEAAGQMTGAARAYLDTFTANPKGPMAPDVLYHLGVALGQLGQTDEACLTLGEVAQRFPGAGVVADARSARQNLGCR